MNSAFSGHKYVSSLAVYQRVSDQEKLAMGNAAASHISSADWTNLRTWKHWSTLLIWTCWPNILNCKCRSNLWSWQCRSHLWSWESQSPLGENVLLKYIQAMPLWRFFAFLFTNLMFQNKNNKQTKSKPELKKKKKTNKQSKNKTN
jgi:hypothetical protein